MSSSQACLGWSDYFVRYRPDTFLKESDRNAPSSLGKIALGSLCRDALDLKDKKGQTLWQYALASKSIVLIQKIIENHPFERLLDGIEEGQLANLRKLKFLSLEEKRNILQIDPNVTSGVQEHFTRTVTRKNPHEQYATVQLKKGFLDELLTSDIGSDPSLQGYYFKKAIEVRSQPLLLLLKRLNCNFGLIFEETHYVPKQSKIEQSILFYALTQLYAAKKKTGEDQAPLVRFILFLMEQIENVNTVGSYLGKEGKKFQTTPLHLAVLAQEPSLVQALVNKGAAVNARNSEGFTPKDLVAATGELQSEISQVLDAASARRTNAFARLSFRLLS